MLEKRLVNIPIDKDTFEMYQEDLQFERPSDKPCVTLYDNTFKDGVNVSLVLYTTHGAFIKADIMDTRRGYGVEFSLHSLCAKHEASFDDVTYAIKLIPIN